MRSFDAVADISFIGKWGGESRHAVHHDAFLSGAVGR